MKRVFFAFTLLWPLLISAQDKTTIGINAGATFSGIRGDVDDSVKDGFDFLAGISLETPIRENFSLLVNVNYERKTSKTTYTDFNDPTQEIDGKFRMHYITVPVNLKSYFGSKKNFFVHAGPYAAFFIDDTFLAGETIENEFVGDSEFKKLDFGLTSGIGMRIPVSDKNLISLGFRVNLGLANISDMPDYNIKTASMNLILTWENIL